MRKCQKPSLGELDKEQTRFFHDVEMVARRKRQLERVPDIDGRIRYLSKNSVPEYRKAT